ncbi:HlyD family efflux transporter periplasmic adaptor subunit [Thalassomonas viridans]|uniref:HlyD family efflux transporter periplasmic adaptor subunit n=1 Tax=Thalassomonas viridans TaxID=137584 RepID=A0AAE9Z5X3_9GAMM|nr:HlyD family efflux transporter periplasmic adaptor subunit [Thalassomonas viridans]WDE06862.1 HlyD family efflux transporter periplasmic adaptor subunit [Thalassomonas viridans]
MKIQDTSNQDVQIVQEKSNAKLVLLSLFSLVILTAIIWQLAPAASRWAQAEKSVARDRVRIATVSRGDFTRDIAVQGRVVAAISPTVYSPADGTITLAIEAGHEVGKGQVLATLDSPELTNELSQQQAIHAGLKSDIERQQIQAKRQKLSDQKAVDLANVKLITAKREKRRAEQGFSKNAISQIDYEKAEDDLQNATLLYRHAVQDAELNIESLNFDSKSLALDLRRQTLKIDELQRQVDALQIRSPVSGIVGNLNSENKSFLSKNQPILTVVDLSRFEVEIQIPETYADDLALGMAADIDVEQDIYPAQLVTISPEIINNQVTARVRFTDTMPPGLRQNQRLTTKIILEHKSQVLQVARGQFMESSGGKFAYKVFGELARKTPIDIGAKSLSHIEILSGLHEGEQIIISGTDSFQAADQVLISQ